MYTLYNLFRNIVENTTGEYTTVNTSLLRYLDSAIQKMSEVHEHIVHEVLNVTDADLNAGYITLSSEPIEILEGLSESYRRRGWDYGKGNQIRVIDKSYWTTGEYELRYRAKYKQYKGQMRDDDYFDFDEDAYLSIILYAVGLYAKMNKIVNEDGSFGTIRRKTEENLTIEYAVGGDVAIAESPQGMIDAAIDMFRELPNAQDMFFSV